MDDWCIYDFERNIVVFRGTEEECFSVLDEFEDKDVQVIPEGEV